MDIEACRRLVEAACPELPADRIVVNGQGWSSLVIEVDGEMIFRFPRRPEIYPDLLKELALLPHLGRSLPAAVPQVVQSLAPGPGVEQPFMAYRKIPGAALDARLAALPGVAEQLGAILTSLHGMALPWTVHRHLPLRSIFDWKRHYLDLYQQVRRLVLPLLDPSLQGRTIALWEGFLRLRDSFRYDLALLHGDLGGEHILCHPETGQVQGVIDWEDACTGDPALDFVGLYLAGGRPFVERVLANYGRDIGFNFWSRLEFYTKIVPYYQVLHGLETGEDHHTRAGLEELQRILDD